nr:ATP-binding cassette domain-containing protein [Candidatus Baldrarchaeota archaeon]
MPIGNRGEKAEHKPVIIVRDLWHVYPGGIEALRGVSLEIYPREFIVILGQNGSGKTTLVKHFNGLLKPTRGEVIVYGMDTKTVSIAELAKKVGYVFQNPDHQIFSRTVREEIAFGPKNLKLSEEEIDERVAEAARILKIEEYLDENPFNLSWGLRQRVAIASILSMKPEVLIVDEPTTGQDHKTGREIMEILCKLNKEGITIIVITHDMKLAAEYAQRAIVMKEGHILLDGNIRDVFSKIEVLKEAYLMPPQITQLSLKLRKYGVPTALRVEEFIQFLNDMGVI